MDLLGSVDLGDLGSLGTFLISGLALAVSLCTWWNQRKHERANSVVTLQRRWRTDLAVHRDVLRALLARVDEQAKSDSKTSDAAPSALYSSAGEEERDEQSSSYKKNSGPALWVLYSSAGTESGDARTINQEIAAGRAILAFAEEVLILRHRGALDVDDIRQIISTEDADFLQAVRETFENVLTEYPRKTPKHYEMIGQFVKIITHQRLGDLLSLLRVQRRRPSRSRAAG